jgi:hypothetical protein
VNAADPHSTTVSSRSVSPWFAFLILLVVVVALFALGFPSSIGPEDGPSVSYEPKTAITSERAKKIFGELNALRHQAYETRDATLITRLYSEGSPVKPLVQEELARLQEDKVFDQSAYKTIDLTILLARGDKIRLREQVMITPYFVNEEGKDVTSSRGSIEQIVVWTLINEGDAWRIHDSVIESSKST